MPVLFKPYLIRSVKQHESSEQKDCGRHQRKGQTGPGTLRFQRADEGRCDHG